jgi:predicted phosphoadenosine phosphosulfate sulfurtransferase
MTVKPRISTSKRGLGIDVLTAARQRIEWAFDTCPRICVSFSGGKDSTVMLHLVMDEAIARRRKVGVLFVDLEGQYTLTIDHVAACLTRYAANVDPYWIALPIVLRNSVSQFEPKWVCWDEAERERWIRTPPEMAITDPLRWGWYRHAMEFEELVPAFSEWYAQDKLMASFVGIRADESLDRFRAVARNVTRFEGLKYTTYQGGSVYNVYPIYDWRVEDIWTYHARYPERESNQLYNRMQCAGVPLSSQRICQPYGDDQRKGLWLFHLIEPETWGKVVARVSGANQGALYAQESGNILGMRHIDKPPGHSWASFAEMLLGSMPPPLSDHYRDKIAVFIHWYHMRGQLVIPDEIDAKDEAAKKAPSWRRVCKMLLRNDYWAKGLSFSQTDSASYQRYKKIMKIRRLRWGM